MYWDAYTQVYQRLMGGESILNKLQNGTAWEETVKENLAPVQMDFKPITTLITWVRRG